MKTKAEKPFTKRVEESDGGIRIFYNVEGFWGDVITVVQDPSLRDLVWYRPEIYRSSGGQKCDRDKYLWAEENFAAALLDAIKEAKKLAKRTGKSINGKQEKSR